MKDVIFYSHAFLVVSIQPIKYLSTSDTLINSIINFFLCFHNLLYYQPCLPNVWPQVQLG